MVVASRLPDGLIRLSMTHWTGSEERRLPARVLAELQESTAWLRRPLIQNRTVDFIVDSKRRIRLWTRSDEHGHVYEWDAGVDYFRTQTSKTLVRVGKC